MAADTTFTARVEIVDVADLNAASYYVLFDPNVLELTNVTGGMVGGTTVPVDLWNQEGLPSGVVAIAQSIPGLGAASGLGYLADITFKVVGEESSTSGITFGSAQEQGVLSNTLAEAIDADWTGTAVQVVAQ